MKLRFLFFTVCALLSLHGAGAEEFKIGEAKYLVRADGKAELKEYKKASGDIVVPAEVSHPKTGKKYPVVAIGKEAFKKSLLTSVTMPESVYSVGEGAFKECGLLAKAALSAAVKELPSDVFSGCRSLTECNISNLTSVGDFAFRGCDLRSLVIPPSAKYLGFRCFTDNSRLTRVDIPASYSPLYFGLGVFLGCPISTLVFDRDIVYTGDRGRDAYFPNRPFNNNPALVQVTVGENVSTLASDFFEGCPALRSITLQGVGDIDSFIRALSSADSGVEIMYEGSQYTPASLKSKLHFRQLAANCVSKAKENPYELKKSWQAFDIDIIAANLDDFFKMLYDVSDVVIEEWKAPIDIEPVSIVANNLICAICMENGCRRFGTLRIWAEMDLLRKEAVADTTRERDYKIILALAEKALNQKSGSSNVYACALKLAGLCGTGRWQEAAAYYPTAHRMITENGLYAVPYELTYMRDVINAKGYRAKDPVYTSGGNKSTSKGKGKSKAKTKAK